MDPAFYFFFWMVYLELVVGVVLFSYLVRRFTRGQFETALRAAALIRRFGATIEGAPHGARRKETA
jgi:hypothetical protein